MKNIILPLILFSSFAQASFRPIPENEDVRRLLNGERQISSLVEVERLSLNQARTQVPLWSGHYWPHYQGSLGIRYRDPSFIQLIKKTSKFNEFKDLKDERPLSLYYGRENYLSPAEKYDLVAGDHDMTLTKYSWDLGDKASTFRSVPTWRGICDGWSAASQMMPRPTKSVTLSTPSGTPITFYPEDIKALGSLSYSRSQENVTFLGKRCSTVLGIFKANCKGTNAAAFHKALINRVGHLKKTFIADVSPGSEVWNYPVQSYKITYLNVFSKNESNNFREQMERFEDKERFKKHGQRHDNTYAIVGVKAQVSYINMREANLLETDSTAQDSVLEKTYLYDLELDVNYNIIGGEWSQKDIPDFIWAPGDRTYPLAEVEKRSIPTTAREMTEAAKIASKNGQPLSIIVEKLFELAR
jgi:disulfide oxidoreductase YuzD